MSNTNTRTAEIRLPYFKQGDDMHNCLVIENNKINARASIENHINLLRAAIDKLDKIKNMLPENSDFQISADTHCIEITGDKNIIERLEANGLVNIEEDLDDDELCD